MAEPFEGHDYLGRFREDLLPHWVDYLSFSDKEIHPFISKHESLLDRGC